MQNILTIDVEDWYQTHDFNIAVNEWNNYEERIESSTRTVLELLSKHSVHATFFVLGCIAQKHPGLIKEIASSGHEIGSHGGWHRMINTYSREEFRADLKYSKNVLEDITGNRVCLYRAPSWSVSPATLWALQILEEEGFICDSSIQPFKTPLSGFKKAPGVPFHPIIDGKKLKLLEFPTPLYRAGRLYIPFSGGFYLRALPISLTTMLLRNVNKHGYGMIYVHPWETDFNQPRLKAKPHIKFVHYYNINSTAFKLDRLLANFSFMPLGKMASNIEKENSAQAYHLS